MQTGRGLGHAKLIAVGEHWVLDGAQALALAVPAMTVRVELDLTPDSDEVSVQPKDPAEVLAESATAGAVAMARLALRQAGLGGGARVRVASQVPLRRGLGSSAALAVALVRSVDAALARLPADPAQVGLRAKDLEDLIHGRSSGLDPAAAASGAGGVLFCRGAVVRQLARVHPGLCQARWVLVDLGHGRPTREAIDLAAQRRAAMDPPIRQALADATSAAAHSAAAALESGDLARLAAALQQAGHALQPLGVIDDAMQACIDQAILVGALAAKQTGAGLGGVIVALCTDAATAERVAAACRAACPTACDHWVLPVAIDQAVDSSAETPISGGPYDSHCLPART